MSGHQLGCLIHSAWSIGLTICRIAMEGGTRGVVGGPGYVKVGVWLSAVL